MYSPSLFAREIPAVFEHDTDTNKLRLHDGVHEPWVRPSHGRFKNKRNTWLYCSECHERYCKGQGSKSRRHLPYRDRASQAHLKPDTIEEELSRLHQADEAPADDRHISRGRGCLEHAEGDFEADVEEVEPQTVDEAEEPQSFPQQMFPTIEEYRARWAVKQGHHTKPVPGDFSRDNLVPRPDAE